MTQYDKNFALPVVIPSESMANILANVMGQSNLRNLRVAETTAATPSGYAHEPSTTSSCRGSERDRRDRRSIQRVPTARARARDEQRARMTHVEAVDHLAPRHPREAARARPPAKRPAPGYHGIVASTSTCRSATAPRSAAG